MRDHRLVVVSNRVPAMSERAAGAGSAGGLVSALRPALQNAGRVLWFGWSGAEDVPEAGVNVQTVGHVDYATIDLSARDVCEYYEGFSNRTLWPLMHSMPEFAALDPGGTFEAYRRVNERFARDLHPLLEGDDVVWVHDYQLMMVGAELRHLGWRGRIGYFHHTPMPRARQWRAIPEASTIADSLGQYDVLGLQTERDAIRLREILGPVARSKVRAYPISIAPEQIRSLAGHRASSDDRRMRFFGADRLDYTKGIPQRLEAFARAAALNPALRDGAYLEQWAAPSRTNIAEYRDERRLIEETVERVRREVPGIDLRVDFEGHPQQEVAQALGASECCLVTSVADGMNLVAKEYVAIHSAERPGVLVLSNGCGAAEELTDALVFPAGNVEEMAAAIGRAFTMSMEERRERSRLLRGVVDRHTSRDWLAAFLRDLSAAETGREPDIRHRTAVGGQRHLPDGAEEREISRR